MNHEDIKELIAVSALDAVSESEQRVIEAHVAECNDCRADLDQHRQTAALLGASPSLPPDAVWERISDKLGAAPPPLRLVRARSHKRFVTIGAVAAAVLMVATGAITAGVISSRDADFPVDQFQIAESARNEPGAQMTVMTDGSGNPVAEAVVLPDGRGYVFNNEMDTLAPDRTYQLWAMVNQTPISAGLLGRDPGVVAFYVASDVDALAITEEAAGGVAKSANAPVAMGALRA